MKVLNLIRSIKFNLKFALKSCFTLLMVTSTLLFQSCTTDDFDVQQLKNKSYENLLQRNDSIMATPIPPTKPDIPPITIDPPIFVPPQPPPKKP